MYIQVVNLKKKIKKKNKKGQLIRFHSQRENEHIEHNNDEQRPKTVFLTFTM